MEFVLLARAGRAPVSVSVVCLGIVDGGELFVCGGGVGGVLDGIGLRGRGVEGGSIDFSKQSFHVINR